MSLFPFREERHIDQLYQTDDIYDFIGRGTFASVYKAVSLVDGERLQKGQEVALKVFDKRDLTSDKMRLDVINEVEVLRRIHHPNCLCLLDCFHTSLHVVIVMNYVEGTELYKTLRDTVLTLSQVRSVALQLLGALDYLHREVGVVHRDVKPENILLTPLSGDQFHVTLVDFGLSRSFPRKGVRSRLGAVRFITHSLPSSVSADSFDSHCDSPLIATPCGTLNYAAPETVKSLTQSSQLSTTPDLLPRMDVYAVGAILYVMLGGKLPFRHAANKVQLVREMETGPHFEEARWSHVPEEAIELTKTLLLCDPTKRPRAFEALQSDWFREGDEDTASDNGWSLSMKMGNREHMKRIVEAMKPLEGSLYDSTTGSFGGRCISVPFGDPHASVASYFGLSQ